MDARRSAYDESAQARLSRVMTFLRKVPDDVSGSGRDVVLVLYSIFSYIYIYIYICVFLNVYLSIIYSNTDYCCYCYSYCTL